MLDFKLVSSGQSYGMKFLIFLPLALFACKSGKTGKVNHSETAKAFVPQYVPGPRTLVYQTRADYRNLVPVFLSEAKASAGASAVPVSSALVMPLIVTLLLGLPVSSMSLIKN